MANVRIIMTADMEKMLKDFDKQISKVERLQKLSEKSQQASQQIAAANRREAMERRRIADEQLKVNRQVDKYRKAIESLKSPMDKWVAATGEIEQLRQRGKLSEQDAARAQDAVTQQYEREAEQLRKNSQAYQEDLRQKEKAQRVIDSMRTPMNRYQQELRELRSLLDQGKLSQAQFDRAVDMSRRNLDRAMGPSVFSRSIKSIGAMAAGYVSVNAAIQLVNQSLERQRELEREGASIAERRAAGQAKTVQNLFSLPADVRKQALADLEKIDFPDRAGLDEALGRTFSGSAGDLKLTLDVLREAAELTRYDPEELGKFAESLVIIAREAQLDAKEAVSLLLSTGSFAQVTNPNKTAIGLGPVLGFAAEQGRQIGQSALAAAKEAGAIFGAASLAGVDLEGRTTSTGVVTLLQTQAKFYQDLDENIAKLARSVEQLEAKDAVDSGEKISIRQAEQRVAEMQRVADRWSAVTSNNERARVGRAEAQLNLDAAQQALRDAIDSSRLGQDDRLKLETERKQLQELMEIKKLSPNTIGGRFEALRGRGTAVDLALQGNPGERVIQEFIKQVYSLDSTAVGRINEASENIAVSAEITSRFNEEMRKATDLIAAQNAIQSGRGDIERDLGTSVNAVLTALREQNQKVLDATKFDPSTLFGNMANLERTLDSTFNWRQVSNDPFRAALGYGDLLTTAARQVESQGWWTGTSREQGDRMQMQMLQRMDRNIELLQQLIDTNKELSSSQKAAGRETIEQLKQQRASVSGMIAGSAAAAQTP